MRMGAPGLQDPPLNPAEAVVEVDDGHDCSHLVQGDVDVWVWVGGAGYGAAVECAVVVHVLLLETLDAVALSRSGGCRALRVLGALRVLRAFWGPLGPVRLDPMSVLDLDDIVLSCRNAVRDGKKTKAG